MVGEDGYVDPRDLYRTKYKQMYFKCFGFPNADVPLSFWSAVLDNASKSKESKCLEANMERVYIGFSNKATYRKYVQELVEADAVLRVGRYTLMVNPDYAHRGSFSSTETAKENYQREKEAQIATGGKTPWIHGEYASINDSMKAMAKEILER